MATPASTDEFLELVRKSGVTDERRFADYVTKSRAANGLAPDASRMAGVLVRDGILTQFQAEQILQGKWRRFSIGKYKVLERIGSGGMGSVYLCEHKLMRRRVAVKVLPTAKAADPSALERFYREARAVAALDHANIVHAYDIDQDEQLHFLVMEYVDGTNLQDIVKKNGPFDVLRACHYIRQAALGLEHANNAGLVHRDIKPANILVDRTGVVKILDMGLARFFNDEDDMLTKKFDENVLGTADYLSPEQAVDSHDVDIRADIYSLGATFYFMLTGRAPFGDGSIPQKLLWHQTKPPKPVSDYRKDLPPALVAIVGKMMAKDPANRYQLPGELADALAPFTATPIGPPPESEMPSLSRAASGNAPAEQAFDVELVDQPATVPSPKGPPANAKQPSGSGSKPSYAGETAAANNAPLTLAPKARANANSRSSSNDAPLPAEQRPAPARPAPNLPKPRGAPASKEKQPVDDAQATFEPAADFQPTQKTGLSKKNLTAAQSAHVRNRKLIMFVGAAVAVLIVLIVGLLIAFRKPPAPDPASLRPPFEITSDQMVRAGPFTYRKVIDAIKKAKKGDVILLNDEVHVEQLTLDFETYRNLPSEIVIRPAPGKQVTWRTSNKGRDDLPILALKGAANLKVQGPDLTLDGSLDAIERLKHVVEIKGNSPGLTFENVRFQLFESGAIKFENASGDKDRPIRIVDCEITAGANEKSKAGVVFEANPKAMPAINDFIEFERLRFNGLRVRFFEPKAGSLGEHVSGVELAK